MSFVLFSWQVSKKVNRVYLIMWGIPNKSLTMINYFSNLPNLNYCRILPIRIVNFYAKLLYQYYILFDNFQFNQYYFKLIAFFY